MNEHAAPSVYPPRVQGEPAGVSDASGTRLAMSPKALWALAITSVAVFMVTLDNLVVTTAIPVLREDLHARPQRASVDGQRVHADVRGAAVDRGGAGRPFRPSAAAGDRRRDLHGGVGGGGAGARRSLRSTLLGRYRVWAARS